MAVTTQKSTQLTNAEAVPVVRTHSLDLAGKLRVAYFDFTQDGAGDVNSTIDLVKLPPGRVRVFPALSFVSVSALGAARTLDIGYAAYTDIAGDAVAAVEDFFWSAVDVSTAVIADLVEATTTDLATGKIFQSQGGVTIQAKVEGDGIDDGETISGYIVFSSDT